MAQHKTSVIRFLNELNSKEVKEAFNFLSTIVENLETKDDPDSIEVQIVDSAYQAIEKMSMLESHLKEYVRNTNATSLPGNKLFDLYK